MGRLPDPLKESNNEAPLALMLIHPTVPQKDKRLVVTPNSQGQFSVDLPMLERAHWQVQVEDVARTWRLQGQWNWPQETTIDIRPLQDKA